MIKLIRIMVGLVVGVAAFVYLFFFAKWNPEVLGHSVRLTLWNYEAPFEVTVYPVLVLVVGVAMVFAVSYTVGYVPAWLARGKVGRGARKGQVSSPPTIPSSSASPPSWSPPRSTSPRRAPRWRRAAPTSKPSATRSCRSRPRRARGSSS